MESYISKCTLSVKLFAAFSVLIAAMLFSSNTSASSRELNTTSVPVINKSVQVAYWGYYHRPYYRGYNRGYRPYYWGNPGYRHYRWHRGYRYY